MDSDLKLSILTPDRKFYEGVITEITTDSIIGGIEILKNHIPVITMLRPSITTFKDADGKLHKAFLSSGSLKVKDNEVKIFCDAAEWPDEIDEERAKSSKARAEERLSKREGVNLNRAELALYRSLIRLRIKGL